MTHITGVTSRKYVILLAILSVLAYPLAAQKVNPEPVRISGVVMDADGQDVVPFVNIRISNTQYGTSSDNNGYFSLFISPGDTLLFSSIGYKEAAFIMPYELGSKQYSLMQLMFKETVLLDEVVVFPWPTLKRFERAFLDAKPKRNMDNLVSEVKRDMRETVEENRQNEYYYDQMRYQRLYELHGTIPPNNFLNPIRWSDFIRDLNEGKYDKDKN